MKRLGKAVMILVSSLLLSALPLAAASAHKPAIKLKPATQARKAPAGKRSYALAKQESLRGTLAGTYTRAKQKVMVISLRGANGVPYDFQVTPRTHILIGKRKATPKTLAQQLNKPASVEFIPRSNGNIAESIHIG
jgi:hypothetical protein